MSFGPIDQLAINTIRCLSIDAIHSNDYAERLNMGLEYIFFNMVSIRSGYKFNYDEGNITVGIGLNYKISDMRFLFDYAYVKHDYLDSPHRFTLTMAF